MIRVGVTGGIGTGKTTVCRVFSKLGIPIYYADNEAKRLMDVGTGSIREQLIALLGEEIYIGNKINRPLMAAMIFHDQELLAEVNRIVHPRVTEDFQHWCSTMNEFPYVIQESAVLLESEIRRMFDYVVLVTAPETLRLNRVSQRPGMTDEKNKSIMKSQLPEREIIMLADFIVVNDDKNLILPQILDLHARFNQLATHDIQ